MEFIIRMDNSNPRTRLPNVVNVVDNGLEQCVFIREVGPILDDDDDIVSLETNPEDPKPQVPSSLNNNENANDASED